MRSSKIWIQLLSLLFFVDDLTAHRSYRTASMIRFSSSGLDVQFLLTYVFDVATNKFISAYPSFVLDMISSDFSTLLGSIYNVVGCHSLIRRGRYTRESYILRALNFISSRFPWASSRSGFSRISGVYCKFRTKTRNSSASQCFAKWARRRWVIWNSIEEVKGQRATVSGHVEDLNGTCPVTARSSIKSFSSSSTKLKPHKDNPASRKITDSFSYTRS